MFILGTGHRKLRDLPSDYFNFSNDMYKKDDRIEEHH